MNFLSLILGVTCLMASSLLTATVLENTAQSFENSAAKLRELDAKIIKASEDRRSKFNKLKRKLGTRIMGCGAYNNIQKGERVGSEGFVIDGDDGSKLQVFAEETFELSAFAMTRKDVPITYGPGKSDHGFLSIERKHIGASVMYLTNYVRENKNVPYVTQWKMSQYFRMAELEDKRSLYIPVPVSGDTHWIICRLLN